MSTINAYRKDKKLTFCQLGAELGISRSHACDLVHGRRKISARVARRLSTLTGRPWWKILEENGTLAVDDMVALVNSNAEGTSA